MVVVGGKGNVPKGAAFTTSQGTFHLHPTAPHPAPFHHCWHHTDLVRVVYGLTNWVIPLKSAPEFFCRCAAEEALVAGKTDIPFCPRQRSAALREAYKKIKNNHIKWSLHFFFFLSSHPQHLKYLQI